MTPKLLSRSTNLTAQQDQGLAMANGFVRKVPRGFTLGELNTLLPIFLLVPILFASTPQAQQTHHRYFQRLSGGEGKQLKSPDDGEWAVSRLDEMQAEFVERHRGADLIECNLAPPEGNGKVRCVIYFLAAQVRR